MKSTPLEHSPASKLLLRHAGEEKFSFLNHHTDHCRHFPTGHLALPDWIGSRVRSFSYMGSVRPIVGPDNIKSNVARFGRTTTLRNAGAVVESFFSLLKQNRVRRNKYRTRDEARADVCDYIERFYNRQRRHGYPGNLSPVEYEKRTMRT